MKRSAPLSAPLLVPPAESVFGIPRADVFSCSREGIGKQISHNLLSPSRKRARRFAGTPIPHSAKGKSEMWKSQAVASSIITIRRKSSRNLCVDRQICLNHVESGEQWEESRQHSPRATMENLLEGEVRNTGRGPRDQVMLPRPANGLGRTW